MKTFQDLYEYGPLADGYVWCVQQWRCPCHPEARWGYYAAYAECDISDLNYGGSPTYSENHSDWESLAAAHPGVAPYNALGIPWLTIPERRNLAHAARVAAETARLEEETEALRTWERWRAIADWLHPDPYEKAAYNEGR